MRLDENHYKILQYWIDKNYSPKTIEYTTNFTILNYKDWNLPAMWPKFKRVNVSASLDDNLVRGEYMRKGTRWQKIVDNIHRLQEECPQVHFSIIPAVSIFNFWHFADFIYYMLEEKLLDPQNIRVNTVTHPQFMDLRNLPLWYLTECIEKLQNTIKKVEKKLNYSSEQVHSLKRSFESLIQYASTNEVFSNEQKSHNLLKFKTHTQQIDRIRNECFSETFPELSFLSEYDNSQVTWENVWT